MTDEAGSLLGKIVATEAPILEAYRNGDKERLKVLLRERKALTVERCKLLGVGYVPDPAMEELITENG